MKETPKCKLTEEDGRIDSTSFYELLKTASKTLIKNDMYDEVSEMVTKVFCYDGWLGYDHLLDIISEYVEIV